MKSMSYFKAWYKIKIGGDFEEHRDAKRWCAEHFGEDSWTNNGGVWTWTDSNCFRFRNKKDFVLFVLRWS